jgi:hypothetical protein
MAALKGPQHILAFEKMPSCEICVMAVEKNDHNAFPHYENTFLLWP